MQMHKAIIFILIILSGVKFEPLKAEEKPLVKTPRILVNVQTSARFSPQEFANATSAQLVQIDTRNPFKSIGPLSLNYPFLVISPALDQRTLGIVACRYGYRYISFDTESLTEAVDLSKAYLASIPKFSSEIPYLSKEKSREIYDLMKDVDKVLTSNGIKYWATAGTLLGAVRHKGLIPWDDDLDISILDTDEEKLTKIQESLDKLGLELYYWKERGYYKIYKKKGTPIPNLWKPGQFFHHRYPFIDIFVVTLEKNNEEKDIYVYKSCEFYFAHNNERFSYSQIANLSRVPFGPIEIPIPANHKQFLNTAYGTSKYPNIWKKYALEPTWVHATEELPKVQGAAFVEIDDYSPAPY